MRFPTAALFFLVAAFIFFAFFAISSLLLTSVDEALDNVDSGMSSDYHTIKDLLPTAFGIIGAIFFVVGIVLIFIMDSLADEPEYYWR